MKPVPAIVWFCHDLRLADNPALAAAVNRGGPVIPVFIWSPEEEGDWPPGTASKWWLQQSLRALDAQLRELGSRLVIRRGPTLEALRALLKETHAGALFWNRRYEPAAITRDAQVKEALCAEGLDVGSFKAALLHEPWTVQNKSGKPFQVFTPFWRHCLAELGPPQPLVAPKILPALRKWPQSVLLNELELAPITDRADGVCSAWQPGEASAASNLRRFLSKAVGDYNDRRNLPAVRGTSRLSPHLHFGEVSPRQVWHGLKRMAARQGLPVETWRKSQFLAEVGWREFAHHLLFHFPHTPTEPLHAQFKKFAWHQNAEWLRAWQRGRTGYPIVDAGMRELWGTGWMHNRVRMIVASFLVKDLRLPWQEGARWFWDTLVDADLAQNTLGWQWTAGCGADAAPYFRIFNPLLQSKKFDPQGEYIRRWCPELATLPVRWIHQPHQAPPEILRAAGVALGRTYPEPMVNHTIAREVALDAYARMKSAVSKS